ncbi:nucleotidyltransferase family protein [Sulfurovum sp.]|uniref:nucleotidyltransferase domain-containing protein n=1 Tax=Sulfurovum sp. TaxID=1969726 RepID=UPI00260EA562|nr:nucleotidyltransferase family protein [Sulfurovum sp.]
MEKVKNFLPSPDDTLLLKAILLPQKEAIEAWETWLRIVNVDTLEAGTQRLFPLLYVKLKEYNIDHPLMNKFKGIYRQTWYKNQMIFHNATPILKQFHEAEIDCLLLKGVALTILYYKDMGIRHMSDLDILVSPNNVRRAIQILQDLGYQPKEEFIFPFKESYLYLQHSIDFVHKDNKQEVDLHWHIFFKNCGLHDDDSLWQNKQPVQLNGFPLYTLDATDHLMHVCIHGLRFNELSPIRWIVDAKIIIDQNEIAWERLIEEIKKRKVVLLFSYAMQYLSSEFNVNIPKNVLERISTIHIEKIEYDEENIDNQKANKGIPSTKEVFRWYKTNFIRYSQARATSPYFYLRPSSYFDYLMYCWKLSSVTELPILFLKKGWRSTHRHFKYKK